MFNIVVVVSFYEDVCQGRCAVQFCEKLSVWLALNTETQFIVLIDWYCETLILCILEPEKTSFHCQVESWSPSRLRLVNQSLLVNTT